MVFFNCSNCGEALKKNQVQKHCSTRCRSARFVSCVDCGVDFWGNDFVEHTKCISEDQKYNGKDFVPKKSLDKAERKQDAFKQQIQAALSKRNLNSAHELLLNKLLECDNVPNKQKKFENFMKNCFRNYNNIVIAEVWKLCNAEKISEEAKKEAKDVKVAVSSPSPTNSESESDEDKPEEVTLNKKQRKEAKKKAKLAKQLEIIEGEKLLKEKFQGIEISSDQEIKEKTKKKNKNKKEPEEINADDVKDSMKRKRQQSESDNISPDKKVKNTSESEDKEKQDGKQVKFNWDKIIIKILKDADDQELKLKKLQKKVLSEYSKDEYFKIPLSDTDLLAKFTHKVTHNAKFKCQKNTVKLVSK